MRTARKLTAVAVSAALIGAGSLLAAAPAHADINNRCSGGAQTESVTVTSGGRFEIMAQPSAGCTKVVIPTAMVSSSSDITVAGGNITGPTTVGANYEYTAVDPTSPADDRINYVELNPVAAGGTIVISDGGSNSTTYTVTIGTPPGPNPNPSRSSSPAPQTFELSLTPADGTTCTNSSESGSAGTWVDLPAANDCAPPASKPNATLLGWATSPDFPVSIAQRQVEKGWGAYEMFNDAGQLTGVFIPAGGATLISAPGNLYAVWSE